MTDVVFVFEVHQPHRLRKNLFWENKIFQHVEKKNLFNHFFDNEIDKEIFDRAAKKCYFPANQILLNQIDSHHGEKKQAKFSFSLSGVFLEQCEKFNLDLLETFKQLAKTGCVEFLNQTYYHSVASLYQNKDEFNKQVLLHRDLIKTLFNYTPQVFENTELLYNNSIAELAENLGFKGIYTEGAEKIIGEKSPNNIYTPTGTKKIRLLLRNYKLTDDVGFRFSARWWSEWPLTAKKYAKWVAETQGCCVNIFPDYETFGEHHWPETGIHNFLSCLPDELLKYDHLNMATPSEVIGKNQPNGIIDVPESSGTISWADLERDSSGWLGNTMQWAYFTNLQRLDPLVHEADDPELLRLWRYFQISDHLYYMFTAGGGPGQVHSYFSPYDSPVNAFIAAEMSLYDFENRVRLSIIAANEPFLFHTGTGKEQYTGIIAWSLRGFISAIQKVSSKSVEYHNSRGDFERWAEYSLKDKILKNQFNTIKKANLTGASLKKNLVLTVKKRFNQLTSQHT